MTLTFGQATFNGVDLGPGGSAQFQPGITGLSGLPTIRNGDVSRPNQAGLLAGYDFAGDRQISFTLDHVTANGLSPLGNLGLTRAAFQSAQSLSAGLSAPSSARFVYNFGEGVSGYGVNRFVICRARKYDVTIDVAYMVAGGGTTGLISAAVLLDAVDPFIYDAAIQTTVVPLPGATPTPASLTNNGDAQCCPLITIIGPCANPSVHNETTGVIVGFDLELAHTDTLVLDVYNGTAQMNGLNANHTLTGGSYVNGLVIPPGTSVVGFYADSASSPAAMTIVSTNVWS